jgi:hypothetical protein
VIHDEDDPEVPVNVVWIFTKIQGKVNYFNKKD